MSPASAVPTFPSGSETSLIEIFGAGVELSMIVSTAVEGVPSADPPVGEARVRLIVSLASVDASDVSGTLKVLLAPSPSAQFSVPVVVV